MITYRQKIIVFASGSKEGGGSGFVNLVLESQKPDATLDADIVAVVCHHEHGGVRAHAEKLSIPFIYFDKPWSAERYRNIVSESGATWVALSGWLKFVVGLDARCTCNIHPALLSQLNGRFGGDGMYGHNVHEAVKQAFDSGEISHTGVSMHFVTEDYDRGPVFFEFPVELEAGMSVEEIAKKVNSYEHMWQPRMTDMVVHGEIAWDGEDPSTLVVPEGFTYLPR